MRAYLMVLSCVVLMVLATACGPRVVVHSAPDSPKGDKWDKPGPPPHAPAYGYQKKKFDYYPEQQVYFGAGIGKYFWLEGGQWRVDVRLPDPLRLALGARVTVEVNGDDPRPEHEAIRGKYPPGQMKKAAKPGQAGGEKPGKAKGKGGK